MKVIWISFLLIGLAVCGPVGPRSGRADPRSGGADPRYRQQPRAFGYYGYRPHRGGYGYGANNWDNGGYGSSSLDPSYGSKVPAEEAGRQDFYSTDTDELDAGKQGDVGGPEQSRYAAFYSAAPADNDDGEEEPEVEDFLPVPEDAEPVFSDVSDLDPVYSFSSRSRYFRGSKVFQRSRYTPGEPAAPPPPVPVVNSLSRPSQQSRPANTEAKYFYG